MANARKRSRSSAKAAGTRFERDIADFEAQHIDDRIDRAPKHGARDRGDIAGLRVHGQKVTQECKNTARWTVAEWLKETEKERQNDGALAGVVIAKRHGIADPAQQVVLMTLADFTALVTGTRPDLGEEP